MGRECGHALPSYFAVVNSAWSYACNPRMCFHASPRFIAMFRAIILLFINHVLLRTTNLHGTLKITEKYFSEILLCHIGLRDIKTQKTQDIPFVYCLNKNFKWMLNMWSIPTAHLLLPQNNLVEFEVHVTVHCDKFPYNKPTSCNNFSKLFWTIPLSIIRSFSLYTQQWYMSYRFANSLQAGRLQAVSKTVWHIPLLCVQWKTPDDGQGNCPKHVEFQSKKIFWEIRVSIWFITRK